MEDSDDEKFADEPGNRRLNNSDNIVENYGMDSVPGDEDDLEKGEREASEGGSERTKKIVIILCCCLILLIVIGITLGVTLGKDDDTSSSPALESPPTPGFKSIAPTPKPTPAPTAPTTDAPTPPPTIPEQLSILADGDTFVYLSTQGDEEGPFGDEKYLLVQKSDVNQSGVVSLMSFNVIDLPNPAEISNWTTTAMLILQLLETPDDPLLGNVTLKAMRLPSTEFDIEEATSNMSSTFAGIPEGGGTAFDVSPGETEILVDISSLIFGQTQSVNTTQRRRMEPKEDQVFLVLLNEDIEAGESVRFYSAESDFPPRLEIELKMATASPTITPMPSTSSPPSSSPSVSSAPSVSVSPSLRPSAAPSLSPSISASPTETPYVGCFICGEGVEIVNPDFQLLLPVIGKTNCGGLGNLSKVINEEQCDQLLPIVSEGCCSKPFVCSICSDGRNVTKPSEVVIIPGLPNQTCSGYDSFGRVGMINETSCIGLKNITDQLCCGIEVRN